MAHSLGERIFNWHNTDFIASKMLAACFKYGVYLMHIATKVGQITLHIYLFFRGETIPLLWNGVRPHQTTHSLKNIEKRVWETGWGCTAPGMQARFRMIHDCMPMRVYWKSRGRQRAILAYEIS